MRTHHAASLLLTAASCLAGYLGRAQQAALAPLAPVTPVVAPPRSDAEAENQPKPSATPAALAAPPQQNQPAIPEPVVILNGRYLTGMSVLSAINPQQIEKLEV